MRNIEKSTFLTVDGQRLEFRLKKPDAFSGIEILRLLIRLQDSSKDKEVTVMDLISSLSKDELKSVLTSCLNNVFVVLPAGPNPVMIGNDWSYPEIREDTRTCFSLMIDEISWTLEGFFAASGSASRPADQTSSPSNA